MKTILRLYVRGTSNNLPKPQAISTLLNFVFTLYFMALKVEYSVLVKLVLLLHLSAPASELPMLIHCLNLKFMTWFLLCVALWEHALPTQVIPLNHARVNLAWFLFNTSLLHLKMRLIHGCFWEEWHATLYLSSIRGQKILLSWNGTVLSLSTHCML